MASTTVGTPRRDDVRVTGGAAAAPVDAQVVTAAHQAFWLLRAGFTVAPILFGLDKFFNWSVDWPDYLAGWINDIIPGSGQDWMYVVGGVEIAAGLIVAGPPRIRAVRRAGRLFGVAIKPPTKKPPEDDHNPPRHLRPKRPALPLRPPPPP